MILYGKDIATKIKEEVKKEVLYLNNKKIFPHLLSIYFEDIPTAKMYANEQKKLSQELKILFTEKKLNKNVSQNELIKIIDDANKNKNITGIIVNLPLIENINAKEIISRISPKKDVEGIHPVNLGYIIYGIPKVYPATATAAMKLLASTNVDISGKEVVIISHSELVGKPLSLLLLSSKFHSPTITICHIATRDLSSHTRKADIIFSAVGKPKIITKDMIKDNAIIIDIGTCIVDGKIVGDVDFENVKDKCLYISPVPAGVGPITRAILMKNVVECSKYENRI
jgi:methylenetetrahydrofolate dehydrogenase (NADP+)/methenyltetrahydrofolate cyclohydrolase